MLARRALFAKKERPPMTKPIHPRQLIQIGDKPKRIRRTKSEMAQAAARAKIEALWAEAQVLAEKRLARSSPAQIKVATRLLRRWGAI
jgi:hypothetical protein